MNNEYYEFGSKGFKVITDTSEYTVSFFAILALTDAVIDDITFPIEAPGYNGDAGIIGVTLTAGNTYYIHGDVITLASGSVILYRR